MHWAGNASGTDHPARRTRGPYPYTNDGTEPTAEHGTDYSAPITINRNTVIQARAFGEGALPSNTFTRNIPDAWTERNDGSSEHVTG
ncbi:MAG: chitobiase/beta-hexosaminidase C-terminal domain-containing protein [Flavobacteriales bacterium]|nr:chitobiase/beta-hexosaminidase C-terminal domain-containing protein [Flavobacteriales bacterium]